MVKLHTMARPLEVNACLLHQLVPSICPDVYPKNYMYRAHKTVTVNKHQSICGQTHWKQGCSKPSKNRVQDSEKLREWCE